MDEYHWTNDSKRSFKFLSPRNETFRGIKLHAGCIMYIYIYIRSFVQYNYAAVIRRVHNTRATAGRGGGEKRWMRGDTNSSRDIYHAARDSERDISQSGIIIVASCSGDRAKLVNSFQSSSFFHS